MKPRTVRLYYAPKVARQAAEGLWKGDGKVGGSWSTTSRSGLVFIKATTASMRDITDYSRRLARDQDSVCKKVETPGEHTKKRSRANRANQRAKAKLKAAPPAK